MNENIINATIKNGKFRLLFYTDKGGVICERYWDKKERLIFTPEITDEIGSMIKEELNKNANGVTKYHCILALEDDQIRYEYKMPILNRPRKVLYHLDLKSMLPKIMEKLGVTKPKFNEYETDKQTEGI